MGPIKEAGGKKKEALSCVAWNKVAKFKILAVVAWARERRNGKKANKKLS